MLDYRAAVESARGSSSVQGKASRQASGRDVRGSGVEENSFGSVFSEVFSGKRADSARRSEPAAKESRAPRGESSEGGAPAKRDKSAAKADGGDDASADTGASEAAGAGAVVAEAPVEAVESADCPTTSEGTEKPVTRDDTVGTSEALPVEAGGQTATEGAQPVEAAEAVVASNIAAAATSASLVTESAAGEEAAVAPEAPRSADKARETAMEPLERLARQQAARLDVEAASAQAGAEVGGETDPLEVLARTTTDKELADTKSSGKAQRKGLFAKAMAKAMAKGGLSSDKGNAGPVKAAGEEVVKAGLAEVTSLLPEGEESGAGKALEASSSARPSQGTEQGSSPVRADGTTAGQVVEGGVQTAGRTYGATAGAAQTANTANTGMTLTGNGVDVAGNADHLAKIVYAAANRGQSVARMNLKPPELGDLTATVRVNQGRMELSVQVASEAARDVVAGGLERLRENLQQHGIALDSTSITVAPKAESSAGKDGWQDPTGQDARDQSGGHEPGTDGGQPQQDRSSAEAMEYGVGVALAEGVDEELAGARLYSVGLDLVV